MPGSSSQVIKKRSRTEERDASGQTESNVLVQKCGFVEWSVHGITAMASAPSGKVIAVARSDGRLELRVSNLAWDSTSQLVDRSNGEISSLAFADDSFLWVGCMSGNLQLYEVLQNGLRYVCTVHVGGGAIWALSLSPDDSCSVAVACEDGTVRIVEADSERYGDEEGLPKEELGYTVRSCERTSSRVLCLDWLGDVIVCGDAKGCVSWMNAVTGRSMGRGYLRKSIIWCVCFAKNGREVVCGDSNEKVSVWNSRTFTVNDESRIEGMDGDILCVAGDKKLSSDGGETLLFGSANGSVGGIMASPGAQVGEPWVPLRGRRMHSHDIRSLIRIATKTNDAPSENSRSSLFIAGSLDSTFSSFFLGALLKGARVTRVRPFPGPNSQPLVQFDAHHEMLLARHSHRVDLWRLPIEGQPKLMVRLELPSLGGHVISCAVSSNQRLLAVTGHSRARMYTIHPDKSVAIDEQNGRTQAPENVRHLPAADFVASIQPVNEEYSEMLAAMAGAPDMAIIGRRRLLTVIAVSRDGRSLVVGRGLPFGDDAGKLEPAEIYVERLCMHRDFSFDATSERLVRIAAAKTKRRLFALSDSAGTIAIIDLDNRAKGEKPEQVFNQSHIVSRFSVTGTITALSFSKDNSVLAVAWSLHEAALFDVKTGRAITLPTPTWTKTPSTCISVSEDRKSVVVSGAYHCVILAVGDEQWEGIQRTAPSKKQRLTSRHAHDLGWQENLLGTAIMGKQRLVLVHRPWSLVVPTLPDVIPRKHYGT